MNANPTPPFVMTMQIATRTDGIFLEARLEDGSLYHDAGPFRSFDEAKRAYDDLMEMLLRIDGAKLVTKH